MSTKHTAESSRSPDINRLNRAGCLQFGYRGGWEWQRDGEQVPYPVLELWRKGNALIPSYRVRRYGEERQDVEQATPIVGMPCRFGGARPYFVCPRVVNGIACGRRVAKLYRAETYLLCQGRLTSGDDDGRIKLWTKEGVGEPVVLSQASPVSSLAVLRDGRLASGGWNGKVKLWLIDKQKLIAALCLRAGARYIGSDTPWQPSCRDLPSNWRTSD